MRRGEAPSSDLPGRGARTVVLQADLAHDLVHRPAVQVSIGHDHQRDLVLVLVALHRLHAASQHAPAPLAGFPHFQRVVAVAGDPLVDGEEEEVEAVVVTQVQQRQHVRQDG